MVRLSPVALGVGLLCSCASYDEAPAHASTTPVSLPVAQPMELTRGAEASAESDAPLGGLSQVAEDASSDRKLVRSGRVSVNVDAWEPFEQDLRSWLADHGGHVSDLTLDRWAGRVGHGSVTIRVPTEQLDPLLSWTAESVEIAHLSLHTEDVTAQWIDVEARLVALRQTEARLLSLLGEGTADLADVLAAERELGRIRGDVEAFERQQRALAGRVQLASLVVDVSVRQPYDPLVERSLANELSDAWSRSLAAVSVVGRGLLILGVFSLPWLGLLVAGGLALLGVVRLLVRRVRR